MPGIEKVQENAPTHRLAHKIKSTKLGIHSKPFSKFGLFLRVPRKKHLKIHTTIVFNGADLECWSGYTNVRNCFHLFGNKLQNNQIFSS